ncbi:4'-phosphopantetheinyl transferase superfamily [Aspergillus coremiiformis]|uniref:4'-phosphopantetheinyl transferase superfamily n=1 Tax=Aspergillus coremiiformis TaxID=138285 RepID=A0A5N6YRH8_9EURO|nr:4'-phosphopantetheinyl transferase superfamily [Aspergillus coremiiformis]
MNPLPFLNIGTDIVHLPRITRLLHRTSVARFTRRILTDPEQHDFHSRFAPPTPITPDLSRWLAGRFAAKEAARKAAPSGAASLGWKDVMVQVSAGGRPEILYLGGGRVGKLSISHDGEYVIAMVVAA